MDVGAKRARRSGTGQGPGGGGLPSCSMCCREVDSSKSSYAVVSIAPSRRRVGRRVIFELVPWQDCHLPVLDCSVFVSPIVCIERETWYHGLSAALSYCVEFPSIRQLVDKSSTSTETAKALWPIIPRSHRFHLLFHGRRLHLNYPCPLKRWPPWRLRSILLPLPLSASTRCGAQC